MKPTPADKWVEGVSPGDPVVEVAARALHNRFDAVLHYLPLAAKKAEQDVEHVHQLRVWARRASAALRLYRELLPRRRVRWVNKQLRQIRHAANDARDCDVLLLRLRQNAPGGDQEHWQEAVQVERTKAQKAIVKVRDRLEREQGFARRVGKLLAHVRFRGEAAPPRFQDWARWHLRTAIERFFAAVGFARENEAALHELRIRGKELRYAVELLAGAFPPALRTKLYPALEAIQDRLGDVNDLATAAARLRRQVKAANGDARAASWQRLLAGTKAQLDHARREFWEWCRPSFLEDLQAGFAALFTSPGLEGLSCGAPRPAPRAEPLTNLAQLRHRDASGS